MQQLRVGEEFVCSFDPSACVVVQAGLSWDFTDSSAPQDLDSSCVIFDQVGNILDAVFFNKLQSEDGSVTHSGDSKTGEGEGDDETITVEIPKLHPRVKAIMFTITCFKQGDFSKVESARVTIRLNGAPLISLAIGCKGAHTGVVACVMYRRDDRWCIKNLSQVGEGRNFKDLEPLMRQCMEFIIPRELQQESASVGKNVVFNLEKGQSLDISGDKFTLGLGWDTGVHSVDLDSSCMIFEGLDHTENIYFCNKLGKRGAVVHSGDNTTGQGAGDDEQINVDCTKLSRDTTTLLFTITIWSANSTFMQVNNAYCRLVDNSGQEICRYKLSGSSADNGMLMCALHKIKGRWQIKAIGKPVKGRSVTELVGEAKEVVKEDMKDHIDLTRPPSHTVQLKYTLTFVDGKNLASKDMNGFSDPFIKVISPVEMKGPVMKKTLNPVWNYQAKIDLTGDNPMDILSFEVWDHDTIGSNEFMGKGSIDVGSLDFDQCNNYTKEVALEKNEAKDKVSGSVTVKIQMIRVLPGMNAIG